MTEYKEALDKMCSNCRIGAIEQGYKRGCAFVDIDNSRCDEYEALQELIEKATPKKPIYNDFDDDGDGKIIPTTAKCPTCGNEFEWGCWNEWDNHHCECGQAILWEYNIDWGEKE